MRIMLVVCLCIVVSMGYVTYLLDSVLDAVQF